MLIVAKVENIPSDFILLAQNPKNYFVCGETNQEGYEVVEEIPLEFEQRCLPQEAGKYLTYEQIKAWRSLAEVNVETLKKDNYLLDLDFRLSLIELGV